jgi:hypothetical protein
MPPVGAETPVGDKTPAAHAVAPLSVIATAFEPTVTVATRDAVMLLAAAKKVNVPLPLVAGVGMVTQEAELVACQLHPDPARTVTDPVPPADPSATLVVEST